MYFFQSVCSGLIPTVKVILDFFKLPAVSVLSPKLQHDSFNRLILLNLTSRLRFVDQVCSFLHLQGF